MKVSLETKITTFTTLTAGGFCTYLAPHHYLSGVVTGIFFFLCFNLDLNDARKAMSNSPPQEAHEVLAQRQISTIANNCLPGLATASLNLIACAVLASKIANSIIPTVAGFFTGIAIFRLNTFMNLQNFAERTQFRPVIDYLNDVVV